MIGEGRLVRRKSQCDAIVEILSDGRWHTHAEIRTEARMRLGVEVGVLNSRISQLRKSKGLTIEHEAIGTGPQGHRYKLVPQGQLFNFEEVKRSDRHAA